LAGYVYTQLVDIADDIDNALSVIFIGLTFGVVGYVGLQVFKVARKYYLIHRRKRKGKKGVSTGAGIHTSSTTAAILAMGNMEMASQVSAQAVPAQAGHD
jgi:hypothetical protein